MKAMKKLIPAVAMLLVSVVTMSTASFAWFSMSRQVTANGMNVTVTAPTNLLIKQGSDAYGAASSITAQNVKLVPASTDSAGNDDFYVVQAGQEVSQSDGKITEGTTKLAQGTAAVGNATPSLASEGAYFDFTYTIMSEGDENVEVVVKNIEVNQTSSGKSIKPVRVAVIATAAAGTTTTTMFKPVSGAANTDNKVVGSLNSELAQMTADTTIYKTHNPTTKGAATTVVTLTPDDSGTVDKYENVATITIRVWYEGQDTECTSSLGAKAAFNVVVTLADKNELAD